MRRRTRKRLSGIARQQRSTNATNGRRARKKAQSRRRQGGINRREFLTYSAGAGMLLGMGSLQVGCGNGGKSSSGGSGSKTEQRTYVFDLSYMDTSAHDVVLVAGKNRENLRPVTPQDLIDLRKQMPILALVPDERITHFITREWPAEAIQLVYLQRINRSARDGSWDMSILFYHLPSSSLMKARERRRAQVSDAEAPIPVKWLQHGLTHEMRAAFDDPVAESSFVDPNDQAVSMVAGHPELSSGEPDSAAYIQTELISTQPSTGVLADSICGQGPATTSGGWATMNLVVNPDTGQVALNSQGQVQQVPVWSDETNQFAEPAITPVLTNAKDDTTLGENITDIDPETVSTNLADEPTNGVIWTLHDGMPSVDQSDTAAVLQDSAFSYQFTDQSPGYGYSVALTGVDSNRNVTFEAKNWYVRYLSLYIRYLDANGNPIKISDLPSSVLESFPLQDCCSEQNGEFDIFLDLVAPEWVILGIPTKTTTLKKTFPLPEQATSALILAGGIGSGSDPYPSTTTPAAVMTGLFNLTFPAMFLSLNAAAGVASLNEELQDAATLVTYLPLAIQLVADEFAAASYDDVSIFENIGVSVASKLLTAAAKPLAEFVASALAEGETEDALLDAIPVIGVYFAAIAAIGVITQIAETSAQVAQSPHTYLAMITFTHDVVVTIKPDLNDANFPATATHFIVTANFDQGTPYTITQDLPGTTVSDPQTVTFMNVPFGGMVTVNVGFYSDSGWLAGNGCVGPVDNVSNDGALALEITIMENLVPLASDTSYSQKEIIVLDSQGNHQWQANTTPPTIESVQGECESADGQLCSLTGITVSTVNAAVGYAWESYNSQVLPCGGGSAAQLHQFANLAVTQDPQSEYLFPGCGFSGTARVAYDLLGKKDYNFYLDPSGNKNLIRQIRLSSGTADFDGPTSNKAWGRFQFTSSAMLLHPAGCMISINSSANKIEVVRLPAASVADADAPMSQVYSGTGIREGLLDGPTLAALTPDGTILVLETKNNRIQAFDLGANPVPMFMEDAYFVPLTDQPAGYLDLAVEYTGYMYVLSYTGTTGSLVFRLDIYTPDGEFLSRTTGFDAGKVAVNYWRDLFALNYQVLTLPSGSIPDRTEPSVSHWIPSTPSAS